LNFLIVHPLVDNRNTPCSALRIRCAARLDNVTIEGISAFRDDGDADSLTIPNINGLHRCIAHGIVSKKSWMIGKELRFLRTEMGMTQAELGKVLHRQSLTISRWERGEDDIDANADVLIRVSATENLHLPKRATVQEMSGWSSLP
jgi:DNA-binding transcriptional regulator YiaG